MNDRVFIATTGSGLAHASQHADGRWEVECLLPGSDVRCLATDLLHRDRGNDRGPAQARQARQRGHRRGGHAEKWNEERVARALVERGVSASKIYAGEMAQSDPAYAAPRSEAAPSNRRVDIFFDY